MRRRSGLGRGGRGFGGGGPWGGRGGGRGPGGGGGGSGVATVTGGEVKLKQVCRWSDTDKAAFEPVADFVVARMGPSTPFRALTLEELKSILRDGGVNLAVIRFAGTTSCTIGRSDVSTDERASLRDWVNAHSGKEPAQRVADT